MFQLVSKLPKRGQTAGKWKVYKEAGAVIHMTVTTMHTQVGVAEILEVACMGVGDPTRPKRCGQVRAYVQERGEGHQEWATHFLLALHNSETRCRIACTVNAFASCNSPASRWLQQAKHGEQDLLQENCQFTASIAYWQRITHRTYS